MAGQGPVGPSTGWMRHIPTHETDSNEHSAGAAASNGVASMNGSASAHPHGTATPAPGLDPIELGYSSSDSDRDAHFRQQVAGEQPNGTAAVHSDAAPQPAGAAAAPHPHQQRRLDGAESKLDRARDKARSQKNEVKRQFEERGTRLKVSQASHGVH